MVGEYGSICGFTVDRWYQLRKYNFEHAYKRNGLVENAFDYLGVLLNGYRGYVVIPGIGFCSCSFNF